MTKGKKTTVYMEIDSTSNTFNVTKTRNSKVVPAILEKKIRKNSPLGP